MSQFGKFWWNNSSPWFIFGAVGHFWSKNSLLCGNTIIMLPCTFCTEISATVHSTFPHVFCTAITCGLFTILPADSGPNISAKRTLKHLLSNELSSWVSIPWLWSLFSVFIAFIWGIFARLAALCLRLLFQVSAMFRYFSRSICRRFGPVSTPFTASLPLKFYNIGDKVLTFMNLYPFWRLSHFERVFWW